MPPVFLQSLTSGGAAKTTPKNVAREKGGRQVGVCQVYDTACGHHQGCDNDRCCGQGLYIVTFTFVLINLINNYYTRYYAD